MYPLFDILVVIALPQHLHLSLAGVSAPYIPVRRQQLCSGLGYKLHLTAAAAARLFASSTNAA